MTIHGINRYGHAIEVERVDDSHWSIRCPDSNHSRYGGSNEKIFFWDPEGGPFIGLSTGLREFSFDLPDEYITEIMRGPSGGILVTVSADKIEPEKP